jgi:DNA polymerase III epsilon subunit-like protein
MKNHGNEVFISVDIEASGPIPGEYSMLSVGACEVGKTDKSFYVEIQPTSDKFVKEALDVCGLSMEELKEKGLSPHEAMRKFSDWIALTANGRRPVLVGYSTGFDWSFVNYYFIRFHGSNPFGISGIDIKSVWFGRSDRTWGDTSKTHVKRALGLVLAHTHNALEDAREQAIIFEEILAEIMKKEK